MKKEELEALESEIAVLRENMRELKDMVDSRAWKQYSDLIASQIEVRINQIILTPLIGHDAVFEQEFSKGELAGMKFCMAILQTVIENTETDVSRAESHLGEQDE